MQVRVSGGGGGGGGVGSRHNDGDSGGDHALAPTAEPRRGKRKEELI